ncbi:MAG: DUF167 domain-containing protein [Patescibacteria group bacterium]
MPLKPARIVSASNGVEVKVIPRAKHNEIVERDGRLVVRVTAPADDGQANAAVLEILARHLHVAASTLKIVRGQRSRLKLIRYT